MSSKEMPKPNNGSAAEDGGKEGADKEDLQEVRGLSVVGSRRHSALVWKSEKIGAEVHNLDQFIRVEAGKGKAVLDGTETMHFIFALAGGAACGLLAAATAARDISRFGFRQDRKDMQQQ